MMELKTKATELGLEFAGNVSKAKLTEMIENAQNQNADDSTPKRIKVIITPRDSEEKFGYVGFNGYTAQYQFDEEIEMPSDVIQFLKEKGTYIHDGKGNRKWQSRYIIEKV